MRVNNLHTKPVFFYGSALIFLGGEDEDECSL